VGRRGERAREREGREREGEREGGILLARRVGPPVFVNSWPPSLAQGGGISEAVHATYLLFVECIEAPRRLLNFTAASDRRGNILKGFKDLT
jgi:hypothetical protein